MLCLCLSYLIRVDFGVMLYILYMSRAHSERAFDEWMWWCGFAVCKRVSYQKYTITHTHSTRPFFSGLYAICPFSFYIIFLRSGDAWNDCFVMCFFLVNVCCEVRVKSDQTRRGAMDYYIDFSVVALVRVGMRMMMLLFVGLNRICTNIFMFSFWVGRMKGWLWMLGEGVVLVGGCILNKHN